MTSRQRVLMALHHQQPDRVPIHDSPWQTTIDRWHQQGLPEGTSPHDYFGYELSSFGADLTLQLPEELIEETDDYIIKRNANGAELKNWKHATSTPECRGWLITTRQLWDHYKDRYTYNDSRIDTAAGLQANRDARARGQFCVYSAPIGYDKTQGIVGSENLLMAMATEPLWAEEMFAMGIDLAIDCAQAMLQAGYHFDGLFVFDDHGYRNATLFSPQMYRRLLMPHHQRLCRWAHQHNWPVILHSCGCVRQRVEDFIEAGFDCLQPLEVKAGMDLIELKQRYGQRLAFMGGIDVRCMSCPDPAIIEREIARKLSVAKNGGGYIYHSDHSVPDDVTFQQYQRVIELVHRYGRYD